MKPHHGAFTLPLGVAVWQKDYDQVSTEAEVARFNRHASSGQVFVNQRMSFAWVIGAGRTP
jgi:hypothetical protein